MATRSLGRLTLDMVLQTGNFTGPLDRSQRRLTGWSRQARQDLKRVGQVAAAAGAAVAAGLTAMTRQGLNFVDSQAKTAARLGSTIDDLRALQIAAGDYGIEQSRLERSLASFTKRLGDAARGTGEAQQAFEALGLDAAELARMPLADQLALVADRISQLDTAAERTSIADRLMSGGRNMVNLFEEGGEAIRAAVSEVDEFGLSLSRVDAKRVEDANDAMSRIPRLLEPIRNQLAISMAEPLEGISNHILEASKATGGFRDEISDMVDGTVQGLTYVVDLVDWTNRSFEHAGLVVAAAGLSIEYSMVSVAAAILSGPVEAVNLLIEQMNRIPGMSLDAREQPDIVNDLRERQKLLEGAVLAAGVDVRDSFVDNFSRLFSGDLAGRGIRESIADAEDGDFVVGRLFGALNEEVAEMVSNFGSANDVTEEHTEELDNAAAAASGFADTVNSSAASIAQALTAVSGDPRYDIKAGGDSTSERARSRFEATAFRVGDPSVTNFGGNPTAHPTWSTEALDRRLSQSALGPAQNGGATGQRVAITLNLVGPNGTQSAEGDLTKELADILSSAAGSVT